MRCRVDTSTRYLLKASQRTQGDFAGRIRRTVLGDYQQVALLVMTDQAHQYTTIEFPDKLRKDPSQADVLAVCEQVRGAAKDNTQGHWRLEDHMSPDEARAFRHRHCHLSFNPKATGMQANLGASGRPQRLVYAG